MPDKSGVKSRKVITHILYEILDKSNSFENSFEKLAKDSEDKAFIYMLTSSILRYLTQIDFTLDKLLKKSIKKLPTKPKMALRLGLAQLFLLNTPQHAAVNTSVELAGKKWKGLVNAILREIIRKDEKYRNIFDNAPKIPDWLLKRWQNNWPNDYLKIIECFQELHPHMDVAVKKDIEKWKVELDADLLPNNVLRLKQSGIIKDMPGYSEGNWWVQDYSSQIPVKILSITKDEEVLDLCASPGGKTAQMLSIGAKVLSIDKNKKRIEKFKNNMERLNFNYEILQADILEFKTDRKWNKILLDVPCTSTGTIRKNPDILYTKKEADLTSIIAIQKELLEKSWSLLSKGGKLLYCNCSLEEEEGELQISNFLKNQKDAKIEKISNKEIKDMDQSICKEGWVRILPQNDDLVENKDGFFIACLKKVS
jgi:16S rRNA (cytosine967-C5)-methyltransferase